LPTGFFDQSFEEIFDEELKFLISADTNSTDNRDEVINRIVSAGGVSPTSDSPIRRNRKKDEDEGEKCEDQGR